MCIRDCCSAISNTYQQWTEKKDAWIGKSVKWLVGDRVYLEGSYNRINTSFYILFILACGLGVMGVIWKESLSSDGKITITTLTGAGGGGALIGSVINEIIFRYQPNPLPRYVVLV